MKFTKSILAKASAPAVESEVVDQAKIDLIATGGEGVETAEQKPDVTKDITTAEVDQVIAGEADPENVVGAPSDDAAPEVADAGANLPGAVGNGDEVADDKGVSEVKPDENAEITGAAPTDGTPNPDADNIEAVATGEETAAPSKEDAAAAVAADLADGSEDPEDKGDKEYTDEEKAVFEGAAAEEIEEATDAVAAATDAVEEGSPDAPALVEDAAQEVAEAEHTADDLQMVADAETPTEEVVAEVPADDVVVDAPVEEPAPVEEVAAEPVEPPAVETDPADAGETTAADEVPDVVTDAVVDVEVPAETVVETEIPVDAPDAVIVELPGEEPVGETDIAVVTSPETVADAIADAAPVVAEIPVETEIVVPAEPAFVAVSEGTDVVPAPVAVDDVFVATDAIGEQIEQAGYEEDVLANALNTYPAVRQVLSDALDNGGISVEAAALLNLFTARDGIPVGMGVSTESYGYTARSQTRVSMESIGASIRDWWQKMVVWMKEQAARFAEWIKSIVGSLKKLRDETKAIMAAAAEMTEDLNKEIDQPSLEILSLGGKISPENLSRDLIEVSTVIRRSLVPIATSLMKDSVKSAEFIAQLKGDEAPEAIAEGLMKTCQSTDSEIRAKLTESSSEDGYRQSKALLGERVLRGAVIDNNHDYTLSEIAQSGKILEVYKLPDVERSTKARSLSRDDIVELRGAVDGFYDVVEVIGESYGTSSSSRAVDEAVSKAGEHLVTLAEDTENGNNPAYSELRKIVSSLGKTSTETFKQPLAYARGVIVAINAYMSASISNAEKAESPAE